MLAFDDKSYDEIAAYFGYTAQSLRNFESLALREKIDFFPAIKKGPKKPQMSPGRIKQIISLRKKNHSIFDIHQILCTKKNTSVSPATVHRIRTNAGFGKLPRRTDIERVVNQKNALISDRTRNLDFRKLKPCQIASRVPLISAHCVRSNGWHVRLPFGRLNPQRSAHLRRKIIKT